MSKKRKILKTLPGYSKYKSLKSNVSSSKYQQENRELIKNRKADFAGYKFSVGSSNMKQFKEKDVIIITKNPNDVFKIRKK